MLTTFALALSTAAVPVTLRPTADGWQMLRGGMPYRIQGVGGTQRLKELRAAGGNSMRGWGADKAGEELDEAARQGLTYTVGVWLGHRSYFDYSNPKQVQEQFDRVTEVIRKHREHPALLMWGLGNEMETDNNDTPALWTAIEALAKQTKTLDPNHPVMTVVAEVSEAKIANIKRYAPTIDVLGVNSYGGLPTLPERLKKFGWTKPYVVTEFGPLGPWERPKTPWGAAQEQTSTEKADFYLANWQNSIAKPANCLGGYAFLWGDKQEETPTWFGMFLPSGERTAAVDAMQYAWTGRWPEARAPRLDSFSLNVAGKDVEAGTEATAIAKAIDPNNDRLTYAWTLRREVEDKRYAGEGEAKPGEVPGVVDGLSGPMIRFTVPRERGAYRLYLTIKDGSGRAATANAPFHVH